MVRYCYFLSDMVGWNETFHAPCIWCTTRYFGYIWNSVPVQSLH